MGRAKRVRAANRNRRKGQWITGILPRGGNLCLIFNASIKRNSIGQPVSDGFQGQVGSRYCAAHPGEAEFFQINWMSQL